MSESKEPQNDQTQEEQSQVAEEQVSDVQNSDVSADTAQKPENTDTAEVVEIDPKDAQISELQAQLAQAQQALHDQKEGALRALAEGENAKRRAETEIDKARKFALEKFAGDLLPVIDSLDQAVRYADPSNEALKPVLEGLELTQKTFNDTVTKHGLVVLDPQGEAFNPEQHQAMSMQESAEVPPNTVIAVVQKGYEINGRLLRPAMVMVSQAPANPIDVEA
ncbi:nucleotide exchange factor GrpE [Alteromonas sp. LMIT006]|uniref:nucleotide exchange factor GrpE n=1 Tax=Alteromonadaceae TaxID=72275 RepID=UPI0020CA9120|nr:nucleotide exchange factor GrpE [Alteromonas sp. LMIT006]UTP72256.1 nucleotide exchange factor GrpE [Alteromonas sp. LMIT006]